MSLVEKALKKMQTAQGAVAELSKASARRSEADMELALAAPQTAPVPTGAHPAPAHAPVPAHRTDKVVSLEPATLRRLGLLPSMEHERRLTAEYRQIKRPLVAAVRGKATPQVPNARVIMVASALPGEGKTFTSVNLALSMAMERDISVLLVDGDIAKADISRTFGLESDPGLMDLLIDESRDLASVIVPTSARGLSVLPAGRQSMTATESLSSRRMESVIAELLSREPSRIVLFDSPPLLLTTESRALISMAGQIVLVVRAEETSQQAVADALASIGEGKSVGLVLNQCQSSPAHFYYGYGEYGQSADNGSDRQ